MPLISATGKNGFTLLEMMVVLAIVALMATAWPLAARSLIPSQRLRAEAFRLLSTANELRAIARNTGVRQEWAIVETQQPRPTSTAVTTLPKNFRVRLIRAGSSDEPSPVIRFEPDGSSDGGRIDLSLDDKHLTLRISPITGHAELDS